MKVFGEEVPFRLDEKVRRIPHEPTDEEVLRKEEHGYSWYPRWDYEMTGQLRFRIDPWLPEDMRKT